MGSNDGIKVPEGDKDNIVDMDAGNEAPKEEQAEEATQEEVKPEMSEDLSTCTVDGQKYGGLDKIRDNELSAVYSALYAMAGAENEEEALGVEIPARYSAFILNVKPTHRRQVADAVEQRHAKVCPGVWDRGVNFLREHSTAIAVAVGVAAAAGGGYYGYKRYEDGDVVEEAEEQQDIRVVA